MKKSAVTLLCILLIPLTLYLGTQLDGRSYYLISTLVVMEAMVPFFYLFETRKPRSRELVTIAVMCAISIASRIVIPLPHFKPTLGIIILTGISLGPEAGFMTGAVTAFASNFFYSQGPWTPWQMFAYGAAGLLAGLLFFRHRPFRSRSRIRLMAISAASFAIVLLVVGPILDSCTLFTTASRLSASYALAVFAAGFPANLSNSIATFLTVMLFGPPLAGKLDRLKTKYGILE